MTELLFETTIEILPPERESCESGDAVVCMCCRRRRSEQSMDEDGCGICDECLAP